MQPLEPHIPQIAIRDYLDSRPWFVRCKEWMSGRRYRMTAFGDRKWPAVVIAYRARDSRRVRDLERVLSQDWMEAPADCRDAYDEILLRAPRVVVIQAQRTNVCGCLGHRHVAVQEAPFAFPHDALGGDPAGEMDIAYDRVKSWLALPLSDTALDAKFLEGSRLDEFHLKQYRLKLLSVMLHETNHLVFPQEPEGAIRERSLAFYRDALASYVERAVSTLSLTIDRSFSRLR